MREQIVNVLDDQIYTSLQTTWAKDKEKDLELVINNKTIPYSYVNYIYQEKNQECPVYRVDDGHCGYLHYMMCKGLHLKN